VFEVVENTISSSVKLFDCCFVVIGIGFHGFELGEQHIWYSVDDPVWAFVVWYVCVAELQRGHVLMQGESLVIANQVIDCVCPGTETWIVVLASRPRRTVDSDVALWGSLPNPMGMIVGIMVRTGIRFLFGSSLV
jgi:hypothetical protein